MKKNIFFVILFLILAYTIKADDLSDILQDLAVQIACLGRYSTAQTGVYVTSRYNDPPDWYDPPMMANRFAAMSGNMTRTITFYGVCFDYAQFAWDNINQNQKMYNNAGMQGQQWYIASTKPNDPYTIILYDPVSKDKATLVMNGVYIKENSRHNIYAHDGATGHAWIWIQHNNGTWYWIDPTWTDNTGYVWWGIVKDGKEVQNYPNPKYCVTSNYPKPNVPNNDTRNSNPTYINPPKSVPSNTSSADSNHIGYFLIGYNYSLGMPLGFKFGFFRLYVSMNIALSEDSDFEDNPQSISGAEYMVGYSFKLIENRLFLLIGAGLKYTSREYEIITGSWWSGPDDSGYYYGTETEWEQAIALEIGVQPVFFDHFFLSATYRLTGFSKSGFTIGMGLIF
jgi:hypothetical protein